MRIFSIVVTAFLLCASPLVAQEPGRLTVTGHGTVSSVPDMATITMGVTAQSRTAAAALAANSDDTAKMLAVITAQGVAPGDMQTSGLSLSPVWNDRSSNNNSRPDIIGYVVNNQVTVRVRELHSLGAILDAVVQSGANQFHGLSFGLQDPVPAEDNARVAAVENAVRMAELYAKAAGSGLGRVLSISEPGSVAPQPMAFREMAFADSVPVAQGEVAVRASVTIVYELLR